MNAEIVRILKAKHPEGPVTPANFRYQMHAFSREQVREALHSFPKGPSGGSFGLVEKLLNDMTTDVQLGDTLLDSLAKF